MDREQALSELGLSGEPGEQEVRRAYLKAVKRHPPDKDPERFRLVRDAYELLGSSNPRSPEPASAPEDAAPKLTGPEPDLSPSAQLALILKALYDGRGQEAYGRLMAFEQQLHAGGTFLRDPALAARWQLVRELMNLLGHVPSEVGRALTQAVATGDFLSAGPAVEAAYLQEGSALVHTLGTRAPTLFREVWPFVTGERRPDAEAVEEPSRGAFHKGKWIVLVIGLLLLGRLAPALRTERNEAFELGRQAASALRAGESRPLATPRQTSQEQERRIEEKGILVDEATLARDCAKLSRLFDEYAEVVRGSAQAPEWTRDLAARREEARAACPGVALDSTAR